MKEREVNRRLVVLGGSEAINRVIIMSENSNEYLLTALKGEAGEIQPDRPMMNCFLHYIIKNACGRLAGTGGKKTIARPGYHVITRDDKRRWNQYM